jgi:TonB family protein
MNHRVLSLILAISITLLLLGIIANTLQTSVAMPAMGRPNHRTYQLYTTKRAPLPGNLTPSPKPKSNRSKRHLSPSLPIPSDSTTDTTPAKEQENKHQLTETNQVPILTQNIIPKYPELAQQAGMESNVLIEIIIDVNGKVIDATVIYVSNPGFGFEKNALRAVKQLQFEPLYESGKAINFKIVYPINFVLF